MKPAKLLQPRYFDAFHCIGSDCEDTCCIGWNIHIDKATYDKYQNCSDPEWGPVLQALVTINEKKTNDDDYAKIVLKAAGCPSLSEGLCTIHKNLGEEYLSDMCATYPRVMNRVDGVLQRSLDLSCPEAARLALLNPEPMEFEEADYKDGSIRLANFPALDTSSLKESPEPYGYFFGVRRLVIDTLQDRSYPLWKRLFKLGYLCQKLDEIGTQASGRDGSNLIREHLESLDNRMLEDLSAAHSMKPAVQLETVLELIVARISADSNPRRFLDCYKEFMDGIQWTSTSTMDEIGARYAEAHSQFYVPFMSGHEYMLEHYLVNYAHRTLFPFGLPESNRRVLNDRVSNDRVASPVIAQYMLMTAYFAITRTLLIGMAGFHKAAFDARQVVRLIQSGTKTFEHSLTYPGRVIEMLAKEGMTTPASLCSLVRS